MENKNVGYLIIGIAIILIAIIFIFNSALQDIVGASCTAVGHGDSCPMYNTITQQTYLALAIVGVLVIIGLVLIFTKPKERIIIKKVKEKTIKKHIDISGLRQEDKQVLKLIQEQGTIFQADIIEKTNFGKAKVSRIIDRLEGKGIVERKRRGMTNVVVLKD
ncbi:hypothetical protein COU53_01120 [Candidatus Pacearchaeota archaeon CG10_big_fil_rev_8_21_14_0_10_30_48]|nr:MAG: hypothetical protein COU53_01120 [Candidatus Pacearchaeota archaeon CG10_big_fil_rev_8_21_14_0_10_30_48]